VLLLVTILLVVVAAVTLLIGIFSDNLALIFISIGASALAAIVLGVLSQVSKRKGREAATSTGPEPLPAREPATVGARDGERAAASIAEVGEPVSVPADAPTTTMPATGAGGLPIADYDNLRVNEIIPALAGLDLDQLEAVAQHEETNKNRTTVLARIDDLMDELEAQEAGGAPAATGGATDVAAAVAASIEEIGEPVLPVATAVSGAPDGGFPIADYDDLSEDELIPLLASLDADQLEAVADREEAGKNRDNVLDAIDDRLDILEGIVPAPAAAAKKAPAKSSAKKAAAATKAPAKKAPAKAAPVKSTAKKVAATASSRQAPARTATPTKKTASSAPARKATAAPAKATTGAKKAPAKATTAAKAPARKAAVTATKKTATTAKKAAPVKKAGAAKKSSKR
jgi:hypothetical protein